jgi:isopenicillin N synthase-like dioxygenase
MGLPVVDLGDPPDAVAAAIDEACREVGFFYVVGHGVDPALIARLDGLCREFFALPEEEKAEIAMARGGRAWRGWFPVGGELTSGVPDHKEGLYFGAELPPGDDRPLHGPNLFPRRPAELRAVVLEYLAALTELGQTILRGMAQGLGRSPSWFLHRLTADPLILFRVFHYPPPGDDRWGVGEHTDYGLLTLLGQDQHPGLQVRTRQGWIDAPPLPGSFVCNLGDMLERLTAGAYRSTAHRVRNTTGADRLSFPFFLDPTWTAVVDPATGETYADYILAKVTKVFPDLAEGLNTT